MIGGKGGERTATQSIPDWIKGPAIENLAKAKAVGEIGYMPYHGPDVAALAPQQEQAMRNNFSAQQAFGMVPRGAEFSTGMPKATEYAGGVRGYSSGDLFDQAVAELALRRPDQMERYSRVMNPNINEQAYTQAANSRLPNYSQSSGGGDGMGNVPNYWAQRELEVGPEQARAEQFAQNQKISDALSSFGKIGFGGILGAITGGTPTQAPAPVVDMNIYRPDSGGGGGDYSSYSGAGDAQTAASLSSDYNGGFYG